MRAELLRPIVVDAKRGTRVNRQPSTSQTALIASIVLPIRASR
jgi:hypothetical protein